MKEALRRYGPWLALALAFHAAVLLALHLRIVLEAAAGPESDSTPIEVAVVESAPAASEPAPPEKPPEAPPPEPVPPPPTPVPPPPPPELTPEPMPAPAPPKPEPPPPAAAPARHEPKPPAHPRTAAPSKPGPASASANPGPATAVSGSGGKGFIDVRIRSDPKPDYPAEAKRAHQEGVVIVSMEINGEGTPENVKIVKGSGFPSLDQAAVEGVRRWRFYPATTNGLPISIRKERAVRFTLPK